MPRATGANVTRPPLVSVLIPCHDHAATLPWALASLLAQTHERWECFVVDDGSRDAPGAVVDAFGDPRVHYVRLPEQRGPAYARQVGLERSSGDFVAMLDADDWLYPTKLAAQVAAFAADPGLAVVGCGMAVVDEEGRLLGTRGAEAAAGVCGGIRALPPSCGQATVMLRGDVARAGRFDPSLRRTEDADYLHGILDGRRYRVLGEPLYVYREAVRGAARRRLRSHAYRRRALRKRLGHDPLLAAAGLLDSYAKSALYAAAVTLRLDGPVVRARTRPAALEEERAFGAARAVVRALVERAGFPADAAR